MNPEYQFGDILIKRVRNGWVAVTGSEHDESQTSVFVYEDTDSQHGMRESLAHLLQTHFEGYCQSKRHAGLKISFSEKTREQEEED